MAKKWSDEEINMLIELSKTFYIGEIAKALGRTETAVITKARRLNIDYITLDRKLTEEELKFIKDNWMKIKVSDMARKLQINRNTIQREADLMNLPRLGNNPYKKWTNKNIEKLKKLSKTKTITELAKYFKTTKSAVSTIASHNNIKLIDGKVNWSKEDKKALEEYAKTMNLSEIASTMNKSIQSVRIQASRQGLKLLDNEKYENSVWTDNNILELKKLVSEGKTLFEISKIINKKDETISKKARELNIKIKKDEPKIWAEEEIEKLKVLSKTMKLSELVNEFERTSPSIKAMAKKLNIKINADRKNWTKKEYELLKELLEEENKTPKEAAEILDRTEDAIIIKAHRNNIKIQSNSKRFWTEEEEVILSDLWGSESIEMIAKKLNRTESSILNKVFTLGLGSQIDNNYDGLKLKDISDLLGVSVSIISISWVSLGLKVKVKKITKSKSYMYVEIDDLYEFLEKNQNIWDSRNLEKNILGIEPDWLKEKRENDKNYETGYFGIKRLTKQQLINAKNYYLKINDEKVIKKVK